MQKLSRSCAESPTFDVGGEIIKTTQETLKMMKSGYFDAILEAGLPSEGPLFIDRDPLLLRCLLNMARNPGAPIMLLSISPQSLQSEADYYCCGQLSKAALKSVCSKCQKPACKLYEQWWCMTCRKPPPRAIHHCDDCGQNEQDGVVKRFKICTACALRNK